MNAYRNIYGRTFLGCGVWKGICLAYILCPTQTIIFDTLSIMLFTIFILARLLFEILHNMYVGGTRSLF
jgi:hypothetical protein